MGPQVLLTYATNIQETHREYLKLRPLINTRDNTAHIFTHMQPVALI